MRFRCCKVLILAHVALFKVYDKVEFRIFDIKSFTKVCGRARMKVLGAKCELDGARLGTSESP